MTRETCCVVDQFCTAPANFEGAHARAVCFRCGQAVCAECSSKRNYRHYGKVRLCNSCQIEEDGNDKKVKSRLFRKAGYR